MLTKIKLFFEATVFNVSETESAARHKHAKQIAAASLLMEMVYADAEVREEEKQAVLKAIKTNFDLSDEETGEIVLLAEEEAGQAVCLYDFTRLINDNFTYQEKMQVLEMLWTVALSDNELEKNEEYLVRKISDLLHVSHKDFIRTKLKVSENRE
ncbi:MAG: TerB family tellurite resistance protein [Gammaproteobacteria bacterium]|nr:TerB family tellurite resistance protein [Gammaproteobacteria bacterium]MDH5594281.1 TerB family tellurite resistance protein [Gammaproteobacteria bacterium]MDH5614482.1 TerB family tellurite resistance protein [Gammaproteobacteria bacterium]